MDPGNGSPPCAVCGGTRWQAALQITRPDDLELRMLASSGTVEIWRCRQCTVLRTQPLPSKDQLLALYPPERYPCYAEARRADPLKRWVIAQMVQTIAPGTTPIARWFWRAALFPVQRRAGGVPHPRLAQRVLDIGCGDGAFLEALRNAGWTGEGVEMSPVAAAAAKARGLTVHTGTLETLSFPDGRFTTIRFWHVLEHLIDPAAALRRIVRWLAPGGELILGVPNAASFSARVFGPRWTAWELPRHLYHFTPATIACLLRAQGFSAIRVRHSSVGTIVSSLGPAWDRHRWLRAVAVFGDTVLDGFACGDSLEVRAIRPPCGGHDA